jgi:hypothetical protein
MHLLWPAARALGDALWAPFGWLPALAGLLLLCAACGVVLLLAFRVLTPQRALRRTKDQMSAALYEMRVFGDAPGLVLRAQGRALWQTLRYLLFALPSFVLLVPLLATMVTRAALDLELRPLAPRESALVTLVLDRPLPRTALRVESGPGLRVLPPQVWTPEGDRVHVAVRAERGGVHTLSIRAGTQIADKQIAAAGARVSPVRARADSVELLWSREPPLPGDGPVRRVEVVYPEQRLRWLGLPWYLHLLVLSMLVALALRRRLGVVL